MADKNNPLRKGIDPLNSTEGARDYAGGSGGIPPVKPGIDPRFIQKINVRAPTPKDSVWRVSVNGEVPGDSRGYNSRQDAIKAAKGKVAHDPDYNLKDWND